MIEANVKLTLGRPREDNLISTYRQDYKKDVLWKSLLRLFRRFLKKEALSKQSFQLIEEKSLASQG